jgi:hypothetical protein
MDYLVCEGFSKCAEEFAEEANLDVNPFLSSMQERQEIKSLIHRGEVETAVEKINEINPDVSLSLYSLSLVIPCSLAMITFCFMHHS